MKSAFNVEHFASEEAAIEYVEARLWPDGATCPHCGTIGEATKLKGKTTRPGLWNCRACRKPFTVRMRTVFESSHIPLHIWLQTIYLFCSSKKGISTRQLQRSLGGSMKTAWFLGHRVREAMTELGIEPPAGPRTRLSKSTKPTSAAGPQTGRARSRPRLSCCRWSSAMAAFAASTYRM